MGFWDVLLFNIAAVLGPRWIAAAAHNGASSITLWILARLVFSCPRRWWSWSFRRAFPKKAAFTLGQKTRLVIFTDSSRAGPTGSTASFIFRPFAGQHCDERLRGGSRGGVLAQNRTFLLAGSLCSLAVAVVLNIVGLNIGKWLQNAGGVGTYLPAVILARPGAHHLVPAWLGDALHVGDLSPRWNWDTVISGRSSRLHSPALKLVP